MESHIFAKYPGKEKLSLAVLCQNLFDSQKKSWPAFAQCHHDLASIRTREISGGDYNVTLQYNPARAVSAGAAVDAESIKKRPCFLCAGNRPAQQNGILYRKDYEILCNPAPIFDQHFTVVAIHHQPQEISSSLTRLLQLAADAAPDYTVLYNGPACGASAPDHLHFQMIPAYTLPFLDTLRDLPLLEEVLSVQFFKGENLDRSIVILESKNVDVLTEVFSRLLKTAQRILSTDDEPLMNLLCAYENNAWRLTIFLRRKHRPAAYFAEGRDRIFVSPGAIDMAGVIITPLLADFDRLTADEIRSIYQEVSLDEMVLNKIIKAL